MRLYQSNSLFFRRVLLQNFIKYFNFHAIVPLLYQQREEDRLFNELLGSRGRELGPWAKSGFIHKRNPPTITEYQQKKGKRKNEKINRRTVDLANFNFVPYFFIFVKYFGN